MNRFEVMQLRRCTTNTQMKSQRTSTPEYYVHINRMDEKSLRSDLVYGLLLTNRRHLLWTNQTQAGVYYWPIKDSYYWPIRNSRGLLLTNRRQLKTNIGLQMTNENAVYSHWPVNMVLKRQDNRIVWSLESTLSYCLNDIFERYLSADGKTVRYHWLITVRLVSWPTI